MSLAEKHFAGLPSSSKSFDVSRCKYTGSEVCMLHLECVMVSLINFTSGCNP